MQLYPPQGMLTMSVTGCGRKHLMQRKAAAFLGDLWVCQSGSVVQAVRQSAAEGAPDA